MRLRPRCGSCGTRMLRRAARRWSRPSRPLCCKARGSSGAHTHACSGSSMRRGRGCSSSLMSSQYERRRSSTEAWRQPRGSPSRRSCRQRTQPRLGGCPQLHRLQHPQQPQQPQPSNQRRHPAGVTCVRHCLSAFESLIGMRSSCGRAQLAKHALVHAFDMFLSHGPMGRS